MAGLTPADQIKHLDAALSRRGTSVQLRKTNTNVGQITVPATWRPYKPDEIDQGGIISMGDTKVVISPTNLGAFGIPPQNGWVVLDNVPRRIVMPMPKYDGGTLVRVDLQVRG